MWIDDPHRSPGRVPSRAPTRDPAQASRSDAEASGEHGWARAVRRGATLLFWSTLLGAATVNLLRFVVPFVARGDPASSRRAAALLSLVPAGFALVALAGVWLLSDAPSPAAPTRLLLHRLLLRGLAVQWCLLVAGCATAPIAHLGDAATQDLQLARAIVDRALVVGSLLYVGRLFGLLGRSRLPSLSVAAAVAWLLADVAGAAAAHSLAPAAAAIATLAVAALSVGVAVCGWLLLWRLRTVLAPRAMPLTATPTTRA
jgi:hypothetical protein